MKKAFLIIVLMSSFLFAEGVPQKRLAVLNLKSSDTLKDTAVAVTNLLATELVNTMLFQVLERNQVAKILNEQGFQQTGVTTSAASAGKLLNANMVLLGSLNKLGNTFLITVKIVDVEEAKIKYAVKESASSESDLIKAVEKISTSLALKISGKVAKKIKDENISKSSISLNAPAKTKKKALKKVSKPKHAEKDPVKRAADKNFKSLEKN